MGLQQDASPIPKLSLRDRLGPSYPPMGYDEEEMIRVAVGKVDSHTMVSYQRLGTLWNQVRWLDRAGINGALVECGSWRGGSCGMMALAHLASGVARRDLHVLDSFEGLPEPDARMDGERSITYAGGQAEGRLVGIGKCVGTLAENKKLILDQIAYPAERTHFHVGWFQETLPRVANEMGPIALLRLDGDWYQSTKVCLDHLFDLIVPGGLLILDDYGHWEGCRRATDEFLAARGLTPLLHHIDKTGRYMQIGA